MKYANHNSSPSAPAKKSLETALFWGFIFLLYPYKYPYWSKAIYFTLVKWCAIINTHLNQLLLMGEGSVSDLLDAGPLLFFSFVFIWERGAHKGYFVMQWSSYVPQLWNGHIGAERGPQRHIKKRGSIIQNTTSFFRKQLFRFAEFWIVIR